MTGVSYLRRVLKQAGILLLAAGLAATVAAVWIPFRENDESEITLAAALARQPPPLLWIDARSEPEYRNEHVPGAFRLDAEHWEQLAPKVLAAWEPDQVAIVYCASPGAQASREVAGRLRDFKLGPVFVLQGGWKAWKQKG